MELQKMKYQRLVCNTTPSSLQDWLDEKLDSLGIDGVYTRYILSLLQQDSMDVDPFESHYLNFKNDQQKVCRKYGGPEVLHCGIKNKHQKWKTWGKQVLLTSNAVYYNATILDLEKMRRKAAVECLKSLTDEVEVIDDLVDEVCIKLKNIRNTEVETEDNSGLGLKATKRKNCFNFPPSSPSDEAEKYFAAFPPLNSRHEQSGELNQRKFLKNTAENFWCRKCQKKIKSDDNVDINFEQDNFDIHVVKENNFKTLIPYDSLKVMGNVRKNDVTVRSEVSKVNGKINLSMIHKKNCLPFTPNCSIQQICLSHKVIKYCSKVKTFCICNGKRCSKNRTHLPTSMILTSPRLPFHNLVEIDINAFNPNGKDPIFNFFKFGKLQIALDASCDDTSEELSDVNKENSIPQLSKKFENLASIWHDNLSQDNSLTSIDANKSSVWSYEGGNLPLFPILNGNCGVIKERSDNIANDLISDFVFNNESNTEVANESQNNFTCLSSNNTPFGIDCIICDQSNNMQKESTLSITNSNRSSAVKDEAVFSNHSMGNLNVNSLEITAPFLHPTKSYIPYEISTESTSNHHAENMFNEDSPISTSAVFQPNEWGIRICNETNLPIPFLTPVYFENNHVCSNIFNETIECSNQCAMPVQFIKPSDNLATFPYGSDISTTFNHNTDASLLSSLTAVKENKINCATSKYWDNKIWSTKPHEKEYFTDWMGSYGFNKNIWTLDLSDLNLSNDNKYSAQALSCDNSDDVSALRKEIKEEEDEILKGLCCPKDLSENVSSSNNYESEFPENKSNLVNNIVDYISDTKHFSCNAEITEKNFINAQDLNSDIFTECISDEEVFVFEACDEYVPESMNFYYGPSNNDESYQYASDFFDPSGAQGPYDELNGVQEYSEDIKEWRKEIGEDIDYTNYIIGNISCSNLDEQENEQTDFDASLENALGTSDVEGNTFPGHIPFRGISRRRMKQKYPLGRKPCTFFLEGNCRRNDCRYAHDLSSITCRFWLEGSCFKGNTCPFLHGYMRSFKHKDSVCCIRSNSPDCNYTLESEADFPSLSNESSKNLTDQSQPVNMLPDKGSKIKRKKGKSQSISPDDDINKPEISSSWPGVSKMFIHFS